MATIHELGISALVVQHDVEDGEKVFDNGDFTVFQNGETYHICDDEGFHLKTIKTADATKAARHIETVIGVNIAA